jgi:hypothetical protein
MLPVLPSGSLPAILFALVVNLGLLLTSTKSVAQESCAMSSIRSGGSTTDLADANFKKLNDCLKDLTAKLEQTQNELTKLKASLLKAPTELRPINGNNLKCPEGFYLITAAFQDQPGLGHGALWGPSGVCAKLNVGQGSN